MCNVALLCDQCSVRSLNSRDWTCVCDGRRPDFDEKTRPNDGIRQLTGKVTSSPSGYVCDLSMTPGTKKTNMHTVFCA